MREIWEPKTEIKFEICGGVILGMPTSDEYLRYADECVALAQKTADADARTRLLEMAQAWRDLAQKRANRPQGD